MLAFWYSQGWCHKLEQNWVIIHRQLQKNESLALSEPRVERRPKLPEGFGFYDIFLSMLPPHDSIVLFENTQPTCRVLSHFLAFSSTI
jgi:hypothetical protein